MIRCQNCGWAGNFDELISGSICPMCSKPAMGGTSIGFGSLNITKLTKI